MYVITTEKTPIKVWSDSIEQGALEQARNLANLPFVFKHIAIMPDVHQGYGMPIGGVLATKDMIIIPNAVGVDIGCGMHVVKTNLNLKEIEPYLQKIIEQIREKIPMGFNRHKIKQNVTLPDPNKYNFKKDSIFYKELNTALHSIKTLGGGNHFIEIQKDKNDKIYIMLHSGSRNLGKKILDYFNHKAEELNKLYYSQIPKDLYFLSLNTEIGKDYFNHMKYAIDYAQLNRTLMMKEIKNIFEKFLNVEFLDELDVAHNYAAIENHFGKNVIVHRKGATRARKGELGIIPGSQGTKSYIVEGLGNKNSFTSCSHGAGRKMSRSKARKVLSLEDEIKLLNKKEIIHSITTEKDLDEATNAYKNIDMVMTHQKDLVKIIVELFPIASIKE